MRNQRVSIPVGTAALALAALAASLAVPSRTLAYEASTTMNAADRPILDGCSQVKIVFGKLEGSTETVRAESKFTVPRAEASPLRANLSRSGGFRVQPWDRADYEVEVCKAAGARSREAAQKVLDDVAVDHHGGEITSDGPEKGLWTVFLIVRVPRGASLDLATENGEIGVRGVNATIVARSKNGPIDLKDCAGDVRARTENGPVATSGGSGKQDLSTQNGPVAVALAGTSWDGAGLTAKTQNGPVALTLAPDYTTGVRVDISGHSPLVCSGVPCAVARRNRQDGHRSLVFGNSEPIIRLSTVNGPVAISGPDGDEDDDEGVSWGI